MSRPTLNSKCRLCRAEGMKLYLKGARCLSAKCPIEKKGAVPPGMHGIKRARKPSDYSLQLRAKQKAKRHYVLNETQFRNYYLAAKKLPGQIADNLIILAERRLDNIVHLSGFATSLTQARQYVSHGHFLVNDQPVNVPSFSTKIGDLITLKNPKSVLFESPRFESKDFEHPSWLEIQKPAKAVKIASLPDTTSAKNTFDLNLIIEFYSR